MKFLCIQCDEVMSFSDRDLPGDGTITALFSCGACGREMAMLTNPCLLYTSPSPRDS